MDGVPSKNAASAFTAALREQQLRFVRSRPLLSEPLLEQENEPSSEGENEVHVFPLETVYRRYAKLLKAYWYGTGTCTEWWAKQNLVRFLPKETAPSDSKSAIEWVTNSPNRNLRALLVGVMYTATPLLQMAAESSDDDVVAAVRSALSYLHCLIEFPVELKTRIAEELFADKRNPNLPRFIRAYIGLLGYMLERTDSADGVAESLREKGVDTVLDIALYHRKWHESMGIVHEAVWAVEQMTKGTALRVTFIRDRVERLRASLAETPEVQALDGVERLLKLEDW